MILTASDSAIRPAVFIGPLPTLPWVATNLKPGGQIGANTSSQWNHEGASCDAASSALRTSRAGLPLALRLVLPLAASVTMSAPVRPRPGTCSANLNTALMRPSRARVSQNWNEVGFTFGASRSLNGTVPSSSVGSPRWKSKPGSGLLFWSRSVLTSRVYMLASASLSSGSTAASTGWAIRFSIDRSRSISLGRTTWSGTRSICRNSLTDTAHSLIRGCHARRTSGPSNYRH